jgi:hypothetical protein
MSIAGVDGALVGGASLKAWDFAQIIRFGLDCPCYRDPLQQHCE